MIRFDLDREAARRLIGSIVAVATAQRPLTPGRAGLVQTLAAQLGLDFKAVAEATERPRMQAAGSRSEAEATYLAAAVLLAADEPGKKERAALADLGAKLDLGVSVRDLDAMARDEQEPLAGLRGREEEKPARPAAKGSAKPVPVRPARPRKEEPPAPEESDARLRRDEPTEGRPRKKKPALHPLLIPGAVGGALLLLIVILVLVMSGKKPPAPPAGGSTAAADPAAGEAVAVEALASEWRGVVKGWNSLVQEHPDGIPWDKLEELGKKGQALLAKAERSKATKVRDQVRSLLAGDVAREKERSLEMLRQEVTDALQQAAQDEQLDEAQRRLDGLPAALKSSTWGSDRRDELATWREYTKKVRDFLDGARGSVDDLLRGHAIHRLAGKAKVTRAHSDLSAWFRSRTSSSDEVFLAILQRFEKKEREEALRLLEVLNMIEVDLRSYLAKRTPEEQARLFGLDLPAPGGAPAPDPAPGGGIGTGFYVARNRVLTNAHVVGKAKRVSVETAAGTCPGTVVAVDEGLDLALVQVELAGAPLVAAEETVAAGARAFVYGYGTLMGDNTTLLTTQGIVAAVQADKAQVVIDAKINPGNSGGPLVDADGRWIGVVFRQTLSAGRDLEKFGLAIEGTAARGWLRLNGITPKTAAGPARGQAPPDAEIRAAVVRIVSPG